MENGQIASQNGKCKLTDSGLGNDSHLVDSWATFNTTSSKKETDKFEFHVVSVAALSGNIRNITKSRLFRRFRIRSGRPSKTLIIETRWPSTVWYVPPPFEDQTDVLNKLFARARSSYQYTELSSREIHIVEAKFEIVFSEASFLKSLHIMEDHFAYSRELSDETVLPRSDRHNLFADIPAVIKCSSQFLAGLQDCLGRDPCMRNIFSFIKDYASKHFHVFVKYCSNLKYMQETQRRLMTQNVRFTEALRRLEESPICGRLPFNSFLSLPLGRILKLDLPIKEALKKMREEDAEYIPCKEASELLRKLGHECNEGAKRFEIMGDTLKIANKLDFPVEMTAFPISCSSRRLLKQGSLTHHVPRSVISCHKETLYVFLFNDLLVITRKQSDECYLVSEYCTRDLVILTGTRGLTQLPTHLTNDSEGKFLMLLTIVKQEQTDPKSEMILSCPSDKERQEWLAAASSEMPMCVEYRAWNRPKVSTVLSFTAQQPNQLSLLAGDEVRVIKRINYDWYEGIRVRDGSRGVFPGSHTTLVSVAQAQAQTLKKLYQFLNEETD